MSKLSTITTAEIEVYCKRHGLTNLTPEQFARFAELVDKVNEIGRALPRMPGKSDEPAHVFRVLQDKDYAGR